MSRPLRIQYRDAWYHVMNRGRRGEPVFRSHRDYALFVHLLKKTAEIWNLRVAAYCLVPNHYHLLVQTPDGNISRCMRHIDGVYTQRYNRLHQSDGQLFRGRYKSILVDAESYLLQLVRYIHRNPLRAGLAEKLERYDWSSHKGYLSDAKRWNWLHKVYILSMLSQRKTERVRRYREFVSLEDEAEIAQIFESKKWPSLLGSEVFLNRIKGRFFPREVDDEVPQFRELAPDPDRIKRVVCESYGVSESDLLRSRRGTLNQPRNVAIYLTRRLRGDGLKQVGQEFHIGKYSSVSSVIERMRALIDKDRNLRERVERLMAVLKKSQEQT